MNNYGLSVSRDDIQKWHGANKYEVLNKYLGKKYSGDDIISKNIRQQLYTNFDKNLKDRYFSNSDVTLINNKLPELLNSLREKNIKIALNTGYSKEIQGAIINKLRMDEFIDMYISSEEVKYGRPYPYMIYHLMEKCGIQNPKSVIKFGDTKNDILEGLNAQCLASVGVLSGADQETHLNAGHHILDSVMDIKLIS
tara:strand:- start:13684 stop:14271 length:588 start_codon:yes stop_codon:yes gene_type:complete